MKLTGETITDGQIRELLKEALSYAYPNSDSRWADQYRAADDALHLTHTSEGRQSVKQKARVRCGDRK